MSVLLSGWTKPSIAKRFHRAARRLGRNADQTIEPAVLFLFARAHAHTQSKGRGLTFEEWERFGFSRDRVLALWKAKVLGRKRGYRRFESREYASDSEAISLFFLAPRAPLTQALEELLGYPAVAREML